MKLRLALAILSVAVFHSADALAGDIVLAENGASAYQIVVADSASPSTKHAAEELQKYLEQMTGVRLPVVSDRQPVGAKEISVGDNAHFRALKTDIDMASLGKEGYVIRTVGDHLLLAGGSVRGALYSVYGLLEDHLGCRWFTPDCDRIPKTPRLALGAIDDRQIPALEYREPFVADCFDAEWCAHNRMNSNVAKLEEKHGGKIAFGMQAIAHTFKDLVPAEKYYDEHPEYFSMVHGQRMKSPCQLCCTNPEVMRLCTEGVLQTMRAQPNLTVFSVSQNDCEYYCECPQCKALTDQEGSLMAPVLQLVNHVAAAVEKESPDKIICTLAYQGTRRAPKQMRPRPNVVVWLCSVECCFSHPLATCNSQQNKQFLADIEAWSRVASRLWIWDYTTDFHHYLLPFPNQLILGANIRFYVEHNVKGIFEEDTHDTVQGEMSALGGYVMAKCLWNPNYDANRAIEEFLEAYYGKAAKPIRDYLDRIHDYADRHNTHTGFYVDISNNHLSDDLLTDANRLWQQAEDSTADNAVVLHRVKIARLSADFAILERGRLQAKRQLPANEFFMQLVKTRFQPFFDAIRTSSITKLTEAVPLDQGAYRRDLSKDLGLDPLQ